jgi:hypothetical protein
VISLSSAPTALVSAIVHTALARNPVGSWPLSTVALAARMLGARLVVRSRLFLGNPTAGCSTRLRYRPIPIVGVTGLMLELVLLPNVRPTHITL